jgi:PGF-pre-PGF domain-containing protein
VRVQLKEAEENVRVIVQKLETKPPELPDPPGLVWAYHNISLNVSPDVIENAWIEFWVLKEWLATQEVEKENILMLRFHAGKWEELPTEFVLDNGTHLKFRAYTPGFSPFVVVAETPLKPEVEVPKIPLIPLAVLSLVIVGAAAALLLKKRAARPPVPTAF